MYFEVDGKKCVLVMNPDGTCNVYLDKDGKVHFITTNSDIEEAHRLFRLQVNLMIDTHLVTRIQKFS